MANCFLKLELKGFAFTFLKFEHLHLTDNLEYQKES
ncbi:hypothetical protein JOC78_002785 [Bacillus ectoiniformans]|nr:hypothetical protein [Bacillus ectoiniformans]